LPASSALISFPESIYAPAKLRRAAPRRAPLDGLEHSILSCPGDGMARIVTLKKSATIRIDSKMGIVLRKVR